MYTATYNEHTHREERETRAFVILKSIRFSSSLIQTQQEFFRLLGSLLLSLFLDWLLHNFPGQSANEAHDIARSDYVAARIHSPDSVCVCVS